MRPRFCFVFVLLASCATGPARKPLSDWEIVADEVELVVPDRAADTLYVRAHGRLGRFAPPLAPGETAPPTPRISGLPENAEAFVLPTGALRWRTPGGSWQGWNPGPGMPADARPSPLAADLPEAAVVDGVLVETPAFGPGWGVPRAVALLENPANPAESVAALRGIYALVASEGSLVALDLANDTTRPFQHGTTVIPAISSDGLLGAASMGVVPLAANVSGQAPIPTETVGVFEGPKPIGAFPIRQRPIALYFGAGSLFALLPDRTLWKHGIDPVPRARQTQREQAILRHRDGLLVGMREALDAGDLARAGDLLDALYADALMDAPGAEAESLAKEFRQRARPMFERAVKKAIDDGTHDLALALDKRVRLIDGRGAGADYLRPPTLQLAIALAPGAPWKSSDVDALFTKRPEFERVEHCRPIADRAPTTVCLELTLLAKAPLPTADEARSLAQRAIDSRGKCGESGIELADPPVASVWSCEAAPAAALSAEAFASAVLSAELAGVDLVSNAGRKATVRVPRARAGTEGIEDLLSTALELQIREDSRGSDAAAATRRVRAAVWSGAPAALREVVRADASLRPLPNALGPSKSVDAGTPNP